MNNPTPNSTRTRPQRFGFDVRLLAVLFCFSMAAWSAFGAKPSPQPAMASGSAQQLAVHDIAKPQPHAPQEVRSIPIGEYDVAFQVVAGNPTGEHDTEFGDTVDPPLWRVLTLIAKKKDGSLADVRLLRPLWWLEEQHATVGGHVEIHVPECGIEGQAQVLAIEQCPPIKPRAGLRVVTGVFKHHASQVLDVYVEGLDEPIGTTPNHPFWSEDRQAFVRADELKEGEHLRALNGTPIVRRVIPLAAPEPVFNLEVQCDHVYHVARNGVLVHNAFDDCFITLFKAPRAADDAASLAREGLGQVRYGAGAYVTTDAEVARRYAREYLNGALEFRIPKSKFDEMVQQEKIVVDEFGETASFRILPEFLDEFNAATSGSRRWIEQATEEFRRVFGSFY